MGVRFILFLGRYFVAIVVTLVLWVVFFLLGWNGLFAYLVLAAVGLSLGWTLRAGSIRSEELARAEVRRRFNERN
jgi:NADH:ubiquinone oxidoreductase subunit H